MLQKGPINMVTAALTAMVLMSQTSVASGATCDRNYSASLDKAIAATLSTVKKNDAGGFLAMVSPEGLTIGQEGPQETYASLVVQFQQKSGHFCDLFACAGKIGPLHPLFVAGPIQTSIDVPHLLASATLRANSQSELDLNYRFSSHCTWDLTAIGYP